MESRKHLDLRRSRTSQGCPLSSLLFSIIFKVLAREIRQEKEIKGFKIGEEEVKVLFFSDHMILYTENPKNTTRKLLELITEFGKIAKTKINVQKFPALLYTNSKLSEREIK